MYINAVADSVMSQLCLGHGFYNMTFKIKNKLYIASRSAPPPPPQSEILCAHLPPTLRLRRGLTRYKKCGARSLGDWGPTFRDSILVASSRVEDFNEDSSLDISTLEDDINTPF
jgi:hypothetical protein